MHTFLPFSTLSSYPYAVTIGCLSLFIIAKYLKVVHLPLPPSPPSKPFIGHLRIMPKEFQWRTFVEWGNQLGDLIYVSVFGKPMIILNSAEAARDILDKRAANYSDRPALVLHGDLIGAGTMMPFLRYGNRFRAQRRLMQQHFNSQAVSSFLPLQYAQINIFLKNILASPEDYFDHTINMTATTLIMATYGHEVKSSDDIVVKAALRCASKFVDAGIPGSTLVDLFPIRLKVRFMPSWFPGTSFQQKVPSARKATDDMRNIPFEEVLERRASGEVLQSLVDQMIDYCENKHLEDSDNDINMRNLAGVIYGGGVETSEAALTTFLLMMVCHPVVVDRAQREIDSIVGNARLPTLDDRASLPYIDCILKEVFRINPPLPLCVSHSSITEDVYREKRIPAGSIIIPNIWSMMRDERYFKEPETFSPERFLAKMKLSQETKGVPIKVAQGLNGLSMDDPSSLVFGFGRRACPGRFFADSSAWLAIANLLAVFDIRAPLDPITGAETTPVAEFLSGLVSKPRPFKYRITPRSEMHAALITQGHE